MSAREQRGCSKADDICLACGFCCDGTIFADVRLQSQEAACLAGVGLKPVPHRKSETPVEGQASAKLPQPCAAFDGCQCRVYAERPGHCQAFECLLLRSTLAGKTTIPRALNLIRNTRRQADRVRRLLRDLGNTDEQKALAVRFRQTAKSLGKAGCDRTTAVTYAELTVAMHDLSLVLGRSFYSP